MSGKIVGFQEKPPKGTERSKLGTPASTFSHRRSSTGFRQTTFTIRQAGLPGVAGAGEAFYGFRRERRLLADIGTPAEYRRASYDVIRGVVSIPQTRADGIDASATLGKDVRIEGAVRIGACVRIEDGVAIVGPSILDDGVRVAPARASSAASSGRIRTSARARPARHRRRPRLRRGAWPRPRRRTRRNRWHASS